LLKTILHFHLIQIIEKIKIYNRYGRKLRKISKILLDMAGQDLIAGTHKYETEDVILHSAVP
jgi:hypothetical protein